MRKKGNPSRYLVGRITQEGSAKWINIMTGTMKVSALFVDAQRLDGNQCAIPVDIKLCKS